MSNARETTAAVKAALKKRYAAPEWAILFEVGEATGAGAQRRADAIAMNLYPSRGLELHGFEIKVSRSDWKRELVNPTKGEAHFAACDRWWIVSPPDIVRDGELPPTWGHIKFDPERNTLHQVVAAPKVEAEAWSRKFVAAMLRRASELDDAMIEAIVSQRMKPIREREERHLEIHKAEAGRRAEALERIVKDFEAASGIRITQFTDGKHLGRAVKAVMELGVFQTHSRITSLSRHFRQMAEEMDASLLAIRGDFGAEDEEDADPVVGRLPAAAE